VVEKFTATKNIHLLKKYKSKYKLCLQVRFGESTRELKLNCFLKLHYCLGSVWFFLKKNEITTLKYNSLGLFLVVNPSFFANDIA
jgi:hypothetical protein